VRYDRLDMHLKLVISAAACAAILALSTLSAPAATVGGGVFTGGGNGQNATGAAVLAGTNAGIPLIPVSVGVTGFAALAQNGGYAVTLDGALAFKADAVGVGYGVGKFGNAAAGGTVTAFFDHGLAPFTTLELRGYKTTAASGGTAGFIGLKFSL
jgi:hypothetical protein